MINNRYVAGSDGYLKPEANISRAEFAKVMDNMVKAYGRTGSTTVTHSTLNGNLLINKPNVTVKNSTIKGDLIVGDGVGSGNLILDNTDVTGNILVRGGGINSITIKSNCSVNSMIVAKVAGNVRIVVEDGADLDDLYLIRGENRILLEGIYDNIYIDEKLTVAFEDAEADFVKVSATSTLDLDKYCKIERIDVLDAAASTRIDNDGTISKLRTDAKVTLTGSGTITEKLSLTGTTKVTAIAAFTGDLKVGSELKAGALTPSTSTVNYQWQSSTTEKDGYKNISGAIRSTYTLTATEVGKYIRVVATGKSNYSGEVTSAARGKVVVSVVAATNISGVTPPKIGATPVTKIESNEYTGDIAWSPKIIDKYFVPNTVYTATITLKAKDGYTLSGVKANQFKVAETTTVNNPANSGVITATFPNTGLDYAGGLNPTLTKLNPLQLGKVLLKVTAPAEGHKLYYQSATEATKAPVKGEFFATAGWTEITATEVAISIPDGEYVQVVEVKENNVTRWGKTGQANDGVDRATGLNISIKDMESPEAGIVGIVVSGGDSRSTYYYMVSTNSGTAPYAGIGLDGDVWAPYILGNSVPAEPNFFIQIVETNEDVVLKWGQVQVPKPTTPEPTTPDSITTDPTDK